MRVDTHAHAMYRVPPYYDSMIAKVIVRGKSRKEAISRMKRALNEFVVKGIHTTIPLHLAILDNEEFASGSYDTGIMNRFDFDVLQPSTDTE